MAENWVQALQSVEKLAIRIRSRLQACHKHHALNDAFRRRGLTKEVCPKWPEQNTALCACAPKIIHQRRPRSGYYSEM
jgi:hypothetical protein